jgi:hypothetical protein
MRIRARRPVDEAGGGQAEGFERAEEDSVRATRVARPSQERRRATSPASAYGEADHERCTERTGET